MKISAVNLFPLRGATPDGGWDEKLLNEEQNLHTLVEVITDEAISAIRLGLSSVIFSPFW